ncbi:hypothetical protein HJFPF1_00256 [Paramyrothecium foliicola]|nr:hypothetical protein HJFPF1_00256 [Paramyrothecium foliicola]
MGVMASSPSTGTMAADQLLHETIEEVQGPWSEFADKAMNRTEFGAGSLTTVHGWPSSGGFYILSCDGVELEFLGLDRFNPTPRSQDHAEEDEFCAKMRMLGAKWYESVDDYLLEGLRSEHQRKPWVKAFGWPAGGGVWALKMSSTDAEQKGPARIRNSFSMEERCREIEKLGGVFYADPTKCPDLDLP